MSRLLRRVGSYFGVSEEIDGDSDQQPATPPSTRRLVIALGVGLPVSVVLAGTVGMAFDGRWPTIEGVIDRGRPLGVLLWAAIGALHVADWLSERTAAKSLASSASSETGVGSDSVRPDRADGA